MEIIITMETARFSFKIRIKILLFSKLFKKATAAINFDQNVVIDIKATGSDIPHAINSVCFWRLFFVFYICF